MTKDSNPTKHAQIVAAMRRKRAEKSDIEIAPFKVSARRKAASASLVKFIGTYLKRRFPLPMSDDQRTALARIEEAVTTGGQYAQAAPRGDGKTERAIAATLWATLCGRRRFVVIVGADIGAAKNIIAEVIQELADNEDLAKDWPHVCLPIREAFDRPNRAKYLTINAAPARLECKISKVVFPAMDNAPDDIAGTVIIAKGLTASLRGLRHTTATGTTLRPDLAIIDDPQTDESAHSPEQCDTRERLITGAILGMAGPNKRIAAVLNATVIRKGDLADRLLDPAKHPEWRGLRFRMVYQFPTSADAKAKWKEYHETRREGLRNGDGGKAATDFYLANRATMDAGAKVGWEHRFREGEVSAIQCAYNILCDSGEQVFQAEYQNDPVAVQTTQYELTEDTVLSRLSGFPRLHAPQGAEIIVAAADVNYVGLNWQLHAVRNDAAAYVVDWGKWPDDRNLIDKKRSSGLTEAQAITGAIVELSQHLNGVSVKVGDKDRPVDCLAVDCGFMTDTVIAACQSIKLRMRVIPIRGWSSKAFRVAKNPMRRGDNWHVTQWPQGVAMSINADYWREQAQRAFLLPVGVPGSVALYGDTPRPHRRLCDEIVSEQLVERVQTATATYYTWAKRPGAANDQGDAMTYARALANAAGADVLKAEGTWRQKRSESTERMPAANLQRRQPRRVPRAPISVD